MDVGLRGNNYSIHIKGLINTSASATSEGGTDMLCAQGAHVRVDAPWREAGVRNRLRSHAPQQIRVRVQQLQACVRTHVDVIIALESAVSKRLRTPCSASSAAEPDAP